MVSTQVVVVVFTSSSSVGMAGLGNQQSAAAYNSALHVTFTCSFTNFATEKASLGTARGSLVVIDKDFPSLRWIVFPLIVQSANQQCSATHGYPTVGFFVRVLQRKITES
jgi:hypothetical protein